MCGLGPSGLRMCPRASHRVNVRLCLSQVWTCGHGLAIMWTYGPVLAIACKFGICSFSYCNITRTTHTYLINYVRFHCFDCYLAVIVLSTVTFKFWEFPCGSWSLVHVIWMIHDVSWVLEWSGTQRSLGYNLSDDVFERDRAKNIAGGDFLFWSQNHLFVRIWTAYDKYVIFCMYVRYALRDR